MGVNVFVRFRPQSTKETNEGGRMNVTKLAGQSFTLKDEKNEDTRFTFDRVFYSDASQDDVYASIGKPVVQDVLNFRSGAVICYGQTGAGKTHTMEGEGLLSGGLENAGIVPRVAKDIMDAVGKSSFRDCSVKLAVVEVYMEKIRDLFSPAKDNLALMDDPAEGTAIVGVTEVVVKDPSEVMHLLEAALCNRSVGETKMNFESSRSHCVYTLTVTGKSEFSETLQTGKVHLVDLAGSEKVDKTGVEGRLLDEAKSINKSLCALGKVVYALTSGDCSHVPFRDSKLTRILQASLSGQCRTSLVCCCSPSSTNAPETLSTVRFGVRAKEIKNVPVRPAIVKLDYRKLWQKADAESAVLRAKCAELEAVVSSGEAAASRPGHHELLPILSSAATQPAKVFELKAIGHKRSQSRSLGTAYGLLLVKDCIKDVLGDAESEKVLCATSVDEIHEGLLLELGQLGGDSAGDDLQDLLLSCRVLIDENAKLMEDLSTCTKKQTTDGGFASKSPWDTWKSAWSSLWGTPNKKGQ